MGLSRSSALSAMAKFAEKRHYTSCLPRTRIVSVRKLCKGFGWGTFPGAAHRVLHVSNAGGQVRKPEQIPPIERGVSGVKADQNAQPMAYSVRSGRRQGAKS